MDIPIVAHDPRDSGASTGSPTQHSTRAERQEFFLPVTGFVWFYPEEVAVIDHPAFQRLGRINQLGQSYLVFRGATHKRIEHVLGAVDIVERMIAAVSDNQAKARAKGLAAVDALNIHEERFVRLGALLHDIGHLAAGHTLEDELGLVGQHDSDRRLNLVFDKSCEQYGSTGGRTLRQLIDEEYARYLPDDLSSAGLSATTILTLLIRKPPQTNALDPLAAEQQRLAASAQIRLHACSNMIGNTICADLLDYLYRDWYHVGKPRTFEDRILQYMEIRGSNVTTGVSGAQTSIPRSAADRFVISLGATPKIRTDGVSAILGLLEWRYELAETVLFHRTKIAAAAMLDRALFELWEEASEDDIVRDVLLLSDEQLIDVCIALAEREEGGSRAVNLKVAVQNLRRIRNRELLSELKTLTVDQIGTDQIHEIKQLYGGGGAVTRKSAANRTRALRMLESDFVLKPGSLAMYSAEAKPKIAEVSIALGNDIAPFHELERRNKNKLSGGHLLAQIERFDRLWRLHFYIAPEEKERLASIGLLDALKSAIDGLVLGQGEPEALRERARQLALALAHERSLPYHNMKPLSQPVKAAKGDDGARSSLRYPTGAPSIRSFFVSAGGPDAGESNESAINNSL